jgi:hypothetical protein
MAAQHLRKKKLSLSEVLIILGLIAFLGLFVDGFLPLRALCSAREGTTAHLISQLDKALEAYQIDFGVYPPGDGSGTRSVTQALSQVGPKKMKYFEFPSDLLTPSDLAKTPGGDVLNVVWPEEPAPRGIIHYQYPGIHRPQKFDLWAEDCNGNPTGVNNW